MTIQEAVKKQITKVIITGADALIYYLDGKRMLTVKKPVNLIEISETESSLDVTETTGWKKDFHDYDFTNILVQLKDIQYK